MVCLKWKNRRQGARLSIFGSFLAWLFMGQINIVWSAETETIVLRPSADTALLENFPTNNLGGQTWLNAGTTQTFKRNRALMKFDVAQALPAGARITAVSLTLQVTQSPVDGDLPSTFDLHRVLVSWGEGDKEGAPPLLGAEAGPGEATWTHRFAQSTNTWSAPGGTTGIDFETISSADTYVYGLNFSPYTFESTTNLVADVQRWLDQPQENFGWLLKTRNEEENFSARRFGSREDPFLAPELTIDYIALRWDRVVKVEDRIILEFTALPGMAYVVESSSAPDSSASWSVLVNLPPAPEPRVIRLEEPASARARFYRLGLWVGQ